MIPPLRSFLLLLLLTSSLQAAQPPSPLPNILYILTDDVGYGDLGCYGATHVLTPNIDRLAKDGTRFTDAHSSASVCTPTRFALLTGRYAWRQPGTGIAAGNTPALIPTTAFTLPTLLKHAGYSTALIGKWHLGLGNTPTIYNGDIRPGPLEIGFDSAFFIPATGDRVPCVFIENHSVVGYDPQDPIQVSFKEKIGSDPTGRDPGAILKIHGDSYHSDTVINGIPRIGFMTGGKAARWVDENIADLLTTQAVKFLETPRTTPFFLLLATHDIHEPMVPHPRFRGSSQCGSRGDVIQQLDWTVGQILDTLDRLNLRKNTLVIFTSDNGGAIKSTYSDGTNELHAKQLPNGQLRGIKGSLYEGGHRVPFIARWPNHLPAATTSTQLICHIDTLATFAALTGQSLPNDAGPDSLNILPALLGEKTPTPPRDHLVLQNNGPRPLAIRQGDWILLEKGGKSSTELGELYQLSNDLGQTKNRAATEPEKVRQLTNLLQQLREQGRSRP